MRTIAKAVPTKTPSECREEISSIIQNAVVGGEDGQINKIYDYRSAPNKLRIEATITTTGAIAVSGGPFGNGPYYDNLLDIRVRHDNTQDGLRSAERQLSDLMYSIWKILIETAATTYREAFPFLPDTLPGAPKDMPDVRIGYMFIRVTPY